MAQTYNNFEEPTNIEPELVHTPFEIPEVTPPIEDFVDNKVLMLQNKTMVIQITLHQ